MATIYIKDESGKEFLTKQLNISSARIITPDMQEGTAAEGWLARAIAFWESEASEQEMR